VVSLTVPLIFGGLGRPLAVDVPPTALNAYILTAAPFLFGEGLQK